MELGSSYLNLMRKAERVQPDMDPPPLKPIQARYGQSKLELYGLYWALVEFWAHIFQVKNLVVQVDASNIKGTLGKPDKQPGALNQWILAVKQFNFQLEHVPANKHKGPDALSRQRYTSADEKDSSGSDPEDWIDNIVLVAQSQNDYLDNIDDSDTSPNNDIPTPLPPFPHLNNSSFLENE